MPDDTPIILTATSREALTESPDDYHGLVLMLAVAAILSEKLKLGELVALLHYAHADLVHELSCASRTYN